MILHIASFILILPAIFAAYSPSSAEIGEQRKDVIYRTITSDKLFPSGLGNLKEYFPGIYQIAYDWALIKAYKTLKATKRPNEDSLTFNEGISFQIFYDFCIPILTDKDSPLLRVELGSMLSMVNIIYYYYEQELCVLIAEQHGCQMGGGRLKTGHSESSLELRKTILSITQHPEFSSSLEKIKQNHEKGSEILNALTLASLNLSHAIFSVENHSSFVVIKSRDGRWSAEIGNWPKT